MARYEHLNVYKTSLDLLRELFITIPKFDKQYKYFLGGRIIEKQTDVVSIIIKANNNTDPRSRLKLIESAIRLSDDILIYIRISNELKQFKSEKRYVLLSTLSVEIIKQLSGWKKIFIPESL
jgi:hypothetical protein